jgi:hypothetical protein
MYDRARTTRTNDIDHIMPKSILESNGYDLEKINSIRNFQLLDYGTNRGTKNARPFAEWVNNPQYVKDRQAFVSIHLIPNDETLWMEDRFEDFILERAKLILNKIERYSN